MRQSQLADAMDIERPNLVVIIDELERRELIIRDHVPTDRRAYAIKATLAGRRLYDRAIAAVSQHENALTQGLSADSRQAMIDALGLIESRKNRPRT